MISGSKGGSGVPFACEALKGSVKARLDYGADVAMQDRPDLAAVLKGERFYAEVKHFSRVHDDLNDQAERNAPEFEPRRLHGSGDICGCDSLTVLQGST